MKKLLISLLAVFVIMISANSFQTKKERPDIDFPGTVFIKDSLYFDKNEITNNDWREYMFWTMRVKGENSLEYKSTLPDTTVWDGRDYSFQEIYLRHSAFDSYPVVGIRYDQAVNYCKWRTERVKEMFEIKKAKKPKMQIPNFRYRLPTKAEWELVAKADYSDKTKKEIEKAIKKDPSKNTDNFKAVNSKQSFFPNSYGVCALKNNISEFVQEKRIAKGGNFTLSSENGLIEQKISSIQIEKWLGFRCVCEIIKE
jgi:formylglycine-generating enzyme required for sulfatase activity